MTESFGAAVCHGVRQRQREKQKQKQNQRWSGGACLLYCKVRIKCLRGRGASNLPCARGTIFEVYQVGQDQSLASSVAAKMERAAARRNCSASQRREPWHGPVGGVGVTDVASSLFLFPLPSPFSLSQQAEPLDWRLDSCSCQRLRRTACESPDNST